MLSHWPVRLFTLALLCLALAIIFMQPNASESVSFRQFADCPATPNCVSSLATDKKHFIEPITYTVSADSAWRVLISTVLSLPRSRITEQSDNYLHIEVTSMIFRFTDDVEMISDADKNEIQIRSASRVGYGDFGVNRRRVELIRKLFLENLNRVGGE